MGSPVCKRFPNTSGVLFAFLNTFILCGLIALLLIVMFTRCVSKWVGSSFVSFLFRLMLLCWCWTVAIALCLVTFLNREFFLRWCSCAIIMSVAVSFNFFSSFVISMCG